MNIKKKQRSFLQNIKDRGVNLIYFLFAIVFLLNLSNCSPSKSRNNTLTSMHLRGKVKSVKKTSYNAVSKFGVVKKGKKGGRYSLTTEHMFFNANGNKLQMKWFYPNDSLIFKRSYRYGDTNDVIETKEEGVLGYHIYKFKYNRDGKITEETKSGQDGNIEDKTIYKYDKHGNNIQESFYNAAGDLDRKYIDTYDEHGNNTKSVKYVADGSFHTDSECKYDKKGNRIEQISYGEDGKLFAKSKFKYDENGNVVERIDRNPDDSFRSEYKNKYDGNSNLIEETWFNEDGTVQTKTEYTYEYDKHNNWIKRIEYGNTIPKYIVERQIIYYE